MALKKYCVIVLLAITAIVLSAGSPIAIADELPSGLFTGWLEYGGYNRTYEYYIPSSYNGSQAVPLLFSFHGLGSSGTETGGEIVHVGTRFNHAAIKAAPAGVSFQTRKCVGPYM